MKLRLVFYKLTKLKPVFSCLEYCDVAPRLADDQEDTVLFWSRIQHRHGCTSLLWSGSFFGLWSHTFATAYGKTRGLWDSDQPSSPIISVPVSDVAGGCDLRPAAFNQLLPPQQSGIHRPIICVTQLLVATILDVTWIRSCRNWSYPTAGLRKYAKTNLICSAVAFCRYHIRESVNVP